MAVQKTAYAQFLHSCCKVQKTAYTQFLHSSARAVQKTAYAQFLHSFIWAGRAQAAKNWCKKPLRLIFALLL